MKIQLKLSTRGHGKELKNFIWLIIPLLFAFACGGKLPPPPPKYVYKGENSIEKERIRTPAGNTLLQNTSNLYGDVKAIGLNDIVTIKVVENFSGSGTADTSTSRDSSLEAGIENFFGIEDISLNFYNVFSPSSNVKGSMQNDFKGKGKTTRGSRLVGTITARVVEVMPNGNFVIESRKEVTINNEKQIFVLRGMIRPEDIAPDNTVLSSRVADAEIYLVGRGVIQDKQRPGWVIRILDKIWPF
jgi:flagellar L-ring protein precursor FlgH